MRGVNPDLVGEQSEPLQRAKLEDCQLLGEFFTEKVGTSGRPHQQAPSGEDGSRLAADEYQIADMLGGMAGRVKRPDAEACLTLEVLLVKSGYEGESHSRTGRENQVRPGPAGQITAPTHIVVVNVGLQHVGDGQPGCCTEEPVDVALRSTTIADSS